MRCLKEQTVLNEFSYCLLPLDSHSVSDEGLQPWSADKSGSETERNVSIILVPKCSGVYHLTYILGQGVNLEGLPLLQPLLMHFA